MRALIDKVTSEKTARKKKKEFQLDKEVGTAPTGEQWKV